MKIDFANLQKDYQLHKNDIDNAIQNVLNKSNYIMGDDVSLLEKELEEFSGAKYAITCSSGTDALILAMMSIDIQPGDEIITTPFTFIATAETIAFLKAKPVFVDIDEKTYNIDANKIEEKITSKTKAIIPVSLFGQIADMDKINKIAQKYNLIVIEDAAQSFGAEYKGKKSCNLSNLATTSFFPAKPLGCFGDGGAVFTNDEVLAQKIRSLRLHGQSKRYYHKFIGIGGRLDTIQAAILRVKLRYFDENIKLRNQVAEKYNKKFEGSITHPSKHKFATPPERGLEPIILPFVEEFNVSTYAQYSIRVKNRAGLQVKLKENGIPSAVHYPIPLHLQEAFEHLEYKKGDFPVAESISNEIISLPMNPYLNDKEIEFICENVLK